MESIKERNREDFLKKVIDDDKIILEKYHRLKISKNDYRIVEKAIEGFSSDFIIKDIVFRVVGTGSLGLERYMALVKSKERNKEYLLDIKESSPSCLEEFTHKVQVPWPNEAERIVNVQRMMQPHPPFLLDTLPIGDKWFVIRELQPSGDKLDLEKCDGDLKVVEKLIEDFAKVVAWNHLRCTMNVIKLVKYSKDETNYNIITKAIEYSKDFIEYHKQFREDYIKHKLKK